MFIFKYKLMIKYFIVTSLPEPAVVVVVVVVVVFGLTVVVVSSKYV